MYNKKLFAFILLIMFILPFQGTCSNEFSLNPPKAVEGMLDLSQWQLEEKVIRLDGEWEFYWGQLLEPRELEETNIQRDGYIDLPSSWNHYIINDKELSGYGYATYRLLFKTKEGGRLSIRLPRIFTSYNLWVNEKLIATAGTVGRSRETMTPQYLPQVVFFEAQQDENEIVIQVSNFHHRSGGILESLTLGNEKQILDLRYKSIAYELFLFGSLMIIGAYYLALFFFRKKDTSSFYFGLFCVFVGIRTLFVGERFFIYLFPRFSWEGAHKIQTLTFYFGVPLVLMFFKSIFPNAFHSRIVKIAQVVGITFGGLVLFTPAKVFTVFNPVYQIFTLVIIIYITTTLIRNLFNKEEGIKFIIVGGLALIVTSLNDIIFLSIWMNDPGPSFLRDIIRTSNLSSVGQLVFVFANSLVLAKKFSNALEHEEVMTAQLREVNANLDELVIKRTKALEEARKKLEKANQALYLLSLKDPLTDLWNRRHYDNTMQMEWNRALRHKRFISLMLIDVDYFKAYNDCYGHKAGDECLVQVAQTIKGSFKRAGDLVARHGGEEFVVIMPELTKDEAINMALLVQKTIYDLNIPHKCSLVSPRITVSIGVTSRIPDMNSSPEDLFLAVDKGLYQAKAAGRNQVKFLQSIEFD